MEWCLSVFVVLPSASYVASGGLSVARQLLHPYLDLYEQCVLKRFNFSFRGHLRALTASVEGFMNFTGPEYGHERSAVFSEPGPLGCVSRLSLSEAGLTRQPLKLGLARQA